MKKYVKLINELCYFDKLKQECISPLIFCLVAELWLGYNRELLDQISVPSSETGSDLSGWPGLRTYRANSQFAATTRKETTFDGSDPRFAPKFQKRTATMHIYLPRLTTLRNVNSEMCELSAYVSYKSMDNNVGLYIVSLKVGPTRPNQQNVRSRHENATKKLHTCSQTTIPWRERDPRLKSCFGASKVAKFSLF